MSIPIKPDDVTEVLLVDGWHRVKPGSYTTIDYDTITGWCQTVSFTFVELDTGWVVTGPATSVLAVRGSRRARAR